MERRNLTVAAVAALAVLSCLVLTYCSHGGPADSDGSFVIIHTNDTHCRYGWDGGLGFSTVAALRESYSSETPTFVVDAGDFLQGNSYGAVLDGRGSVDIMKNVGYDVGVPGNHEFDYGIGTFLERIEALGYPVICANLVYGDTGESVLDEYVVIEKGGVKVGFFGLLTPETVATVRHGNMGAAVITDPTDAARRMVSALEGKGVDSIVAIGHLGVEKVGYVTSDEVCAAVHGIDIFIDAHSHTEMEGGKACDRSVELIPSGTVIASTGCYLDNVGIVRSGPDGISAGLYRGPPLRNGPVDAATDAVKSEVDDVLKVKVGYTETLLDGDRHSLRNGETNLGDLAADSILELSGAQVALVNSGGIRASIQPGDITLNEVYDVLPYMDPICVFEAPGSAIHECMEYSLGLLGDDNGEFIQFAGMTVTYDPGAEKGHRIQSITVDGSELEADSLYKVAALDFIAMGGGNYPMISGYEAQIIGTQDAIFVDYLDRIGPITAEDIKMGRLVAV
ncbi:MAG: 5'-nucleotidase C-terminal domain-containing protein [Candidatus Methanomethylophilaceae archaeon]|nr:5'-nucleotidase C-terminal domain-containing protein [Candidatus Methanomethylophilaceae archaeon]